jgi:hypothetical protein
VFADWAYSYVTVRRGARLITAESRSEVDQPLVLLPENVTASAEGEGAIRAPDEAHAPH